MQPDRKIVVAGNAIGSAKMTVTRLMPNGSPDTAFDGDGTATIDFGSLADIANDAVLQPDGKIVVAGYTQAAEDRRGRAPQRQRLAGHHVRRRRQGDVDFGVATFGNASRSSRTGGSSSPASGPAATTSLWRDCWAAQNSWPPTSARPFATSHRSASCSASSAV